MYTTLLTCSGAWRARTISVGAQPSHATLSGHALRSFELEERGCLETFIVTLSESLLVPPLLACLEFCELYALCSMLRQQPRLVCARSLQHMSCMQETWAR